MQVWLFISHGILRPLDLSVPRDFSFPWGNLRTEYVPRGVFTVPCAMTRRQRFALFLSKNQRLFAQSSTLLTASLWGKEGGWLCFLNANSTAVGVKKPKQIVHRLKPNVRLLAPEKSVQGHFPGCLEGWGSHRLLPYFHG